MGAVINACKSTIGKSKTTPETINETHLTNDDKEYQVTRGLQDEFLKNTEDLIQEITTNSKWQHHEVRYLLSQFRKLGQAKDVTNLSETQFIKFLPKLLKSFINNHSSLDDNKDNKDNKDDNLEHFENNKLYKKWLKHFIKLFSTSSDQITFQSFANTLSTACRGENNEKAELLFDIFDIDGDGVFNENELELFLWYVLNIDINNNSNNDIVLIDKEDTEKAKVGDINRVIIKTQFIQYIDELISPKKAKKSEDKTATNGQTTNGAESNGHDDHGENAKDDEEINDDDGDKENIENVDGTDKNVEDIISDASSDAVEDTPLKNGKKNIVIEESSNKNIDFLANMSLSDLKYCDDQALLDTVKKLFKNKLYNKGKLKKKHFVTFAAKSINFDNLFASFMIIPTREDECQIIKELMQQTQMTLGASWFVLSKKWWDQWCAYTGYSEEKTNDGDNDESTGLGDDAMHTPKVRAMRPIKISNRELLDEDSFFTILKRDLQQNNEFILIPKGAWEQLHEWYGGGPVIERFVVCSNKEVRMKALNKLLPKLEYEYQEQERLMKEALKKKKRKQKQQKKQNAHDKDDENSESEQNENDNDKKKKNKAFDIDKFEREYQQFLQEESFMVHQDTLRIDLHPIYCNFVGLTKESKIDGDFRELAISRYCTLPELYIQICARLGHPIKDIKAEKQNYKQYLQSKLDAKTNQRNKEKDKDKKNKKKDDKKSKKDTPKIQLPPRMWTVIKQHRGGPSIDKLLYPIPKMNKSPTEKSTKDSKNTKDTKDTADKTQTTDDTETEDKPDDTSTNPTDDKPSSDATAKDTNDDENGGENPPHPTDEKPPTSDADKPDDTATNGASSKDEKPETDDGNEETTNNDNNDDNDNDDDDLDLETIGLQSGVSIAVEFAFPNKKKQLEYQLKSNEEDMVCQPEIDDSWQDFEVGDKIDGRDRWGKWYEAEIKKHKKANEPMPKKAKLNKTQEKDIKKLEKYEAIFIHYIAWEEKWDEWIFVTPDTICTCRSTCTTDKTKHRLAPQNTQSKYREERKRPGGYGGRGYGGRSSGVGGGYWGGGRESVRGTPSTAGCVGLSNLGNTCFMNSIIQCVSNTPHFRTFFTSGQYKPDINKSNPLGMKGELANEFAKLLMDVWSGDYKVIAPRSLKKALSKFAPQFSGWQQHDSQEFLAFLLDGLHEDLNLIKSKPYTEKIEAQGRPDDVVADLAWKIYLKRNKSKIVDLFQAQQKSHVICPDCGRNSITFDTYMYLSVPIVGYSSKSLIVDVFHRKDTNPINKPTRHIFHVNKYQKVRDLAKRVADHYGTRAQLVMFYENWNMKVAREYDHNLMLGMVPDREALACYILKDWNEEVTPEEIKKKKLSLQLAKLCHSQPLQNGKLSRGSGSNGPLFGMPFVISFLNVHTRREIHQVVYERLHTWVGSDVLPKPPTICKLKKVKKQTSTSTKKEDDGDNDGNEDKDSKKKPKEKKKKNKKKSKKDESDDEDEEEEEEYDYIRPSQQELDEYEAKWDEIFETMPYTLRLMPYRHYSFYSSKSMPEEIPIDDVLLLNEKSSRTKEVDLIIEWNQEAHDKIKSVVNKVVVDGEYSKWKKEKQARQQRDDQLSLYDCINAYVAQETLGENDLWYCSECKKHERANKKLDLWSFPEILIIHLKRFQVLGVGRFGRGEKINTFVECPIRGLDLSPYVIDSTNDTAPIYDLYAVSCHSGSCGGGHYTAYALNAETDRWYYFNDSSVRPARETDIISSSTYVLFYKKCH